jgi:MFS family permease
VWFYLWFRNEPREHRSVTDLELQAVAGPTANRKDGAAPERPGPTPWGALVSSPAMGWICAQQFFRAAGYTFFTSWFATYLQETRHVSTRDAGFLNSLPLLAVVVGSMAGGFLSDRLQARTGSRRVSRQGLAVVSLLCCAGLTVLAYPIGNAWLAVLVVSGGSFFASMAGPCAYTITMDMGGKHLVAVFSLMNLAGNVGAALFPVVVPRLVAGTGSWDLVLFLFAGIFAAAAACWLFLNPAGTVLDQSLARTRTE